MKIKRVFLIVLIFSLLTGVFALILKNTMPKEIFSSEIGTTFAVSNDVFIPYDASSALLIKINRKGFDQSDNKISFNIINPSKTNQNVTVNIFYPDKNVKIEGVEMLDPGPGKTIVAKNMILSEHSGLSRLTQQAAIDPEELDIKCSFSVLLKSNESQSFRAYLNRAVIVTPALKIEAIGDKGGYGLTNP